MNMHNTQQNELEDIKINLKLKLAALWTSFMLLYIYVDFFHLYMPGVLEDMLLGKVFTFDITQSFILTVLVMLTIPSLMIFLSVVLPAKINRWTNLVVATIFIPFTLFNLVGVAWAHMYFAASVEVAILCLVICYAWKWPRVENRN